MLNQKKGFIARHIRHVDSCLSLNQHGMSKISGCIQISTKTTKTTMQTSKTSSQTTTQCATLVAQLATHIRVNAQDLNAFTFGFILDKVLELEKTPIANPIIHSSPTINLSYAFKVFHDNLVSGKPGNDLFADTMVYVSHEPFFSSTNLSQQTFSGTSAFGLQNTAQIFELPFSSLDFRGMEKLAITRDGEVVYSEVNADNVLRTSADIDLFGKHEQEKCSAFVVHSQQALANFPVRIEVLLVTGRNVEGNFYSALQACKAQNIIFEAGTSRKIVFDACILNDWSGLSNLYHSAGLFDASHAELALQSQQSKMSIYEWLQFERVPNATRPCTIDTVLQANTVGFDGLYEFRTSNNLDFYGSTCSHNEHQVREVYKLNGGDEWQFIPRINSWASLPHES